MRGITDPTAKAYWREYQRMVKAGNSLGLSFVEYVAQRVHTPNTVYSLSTEVPWFVSTCGHSHPWGVACGSVTMA
jgi:hypothetical protein